MIQTRSFMTYLQPIPRLVARIPIKPASSSKKWGLEGGFSKPSHRCEAECDCRPVTVDKTIVNPVQSERIEPKSGNRTSICCLLLIVIATLVTFGPLVRSQFTSWDDQQTITANAHLRGPASQALRYCWTHAQGELYIPLTYSAWIGLCHVAPIDAGRARLPNPVVFHAANVLIHLLSVIIAFLILRRLLRHEWAACAGRCCLLFIRYKWSRWRGRRVSRTCSADF